MSPIFCSKKHQKRDQHKSKPQTRLIFYKKYYATGREKMKSTLANISHSELRNLRLNPNEIRKVTTLTPEFDVEALAHWYVSNRLHI